ncbi:MAG: PIN domain-containing protein [Deltaproteobacteria bacterium]|nr:MAG: PIN domain-containing protein [Deltaproteobacteria bacterium]
MIAVDTNVLVMAHRTESPRHEEAIRWLRHLAEGRTPWGLPVYCLAEFVRIVTHRRVFDPPSTLEQALSALGALLKSPSARLLLPTPRHPAFLEEALIAGKATGNLAFDAQIAAVCRENGVDRILTEDRDFARFRWLRLVDLGNEPGTVV